MIPDSSSPAPFPTTSWDAIAAAGDAGAEDWAAAVGRVVRHYWRPVFRYLRSRGRAHHAAEDLTQDFFILLIREDVCREAREARGRFRSLVLRVLQRFLSDRGPTRGGRQARFEAGQLPWSALPSADDSGYDPPDDCDPDAVFRREWAESAVGDALEQVRTHYDRAGQPEWFALFLAYRRIDGSAPPSKDALAADFRLTRDQVRYRIEMVQLRVAAILRRLLEE